MRSVCRRSRANRCPNSREERLEYPELQLDA